MPLHPPLDQEQTRRASSLLITAARAWRRLTIPLHYLLLQQVIADLVGVPCSLGATDPVDAEVPRWLSGYDAR